MLSLLAALVAAMTPLATAAPAATTEAPPPVAATSSVLPHQTVVFLHARQALREHRPDDVLKLWLLRNALVDRGEGATHDEELRSLVWASLGERGLCPDGFPRDDDGAGIWPVAMHNWLVSRLKRQEVPQSPSWSAFAVGRQQRPVALHDVLSLEELRTVQFQRVFCLGPWFSLLASSVDAGEWEAPDFRDRLSVGILMRSMLQRARATVSPDKVEHLAVLDARIFDLDLALVELQARRARERAADAAGMARSLGLPSSAVDEVRKTFVTPPPESDHAQLLRRTLFWPPEDWLALGRDRRLALYARTRDLQEEADFAGARAKLILGIIDGLIDQAQRGREGAGAEIESWIGFLDAEARPSLRGALTEGERGQRLLALEPETGFTARSVIALHRAVAFLEEGRVQEALISLGFALTHADASTAADATRALSLRWLSYVASQYETTPELVDALATISVRRDVARILEDLLWRAALRADLRSFQVVVERAPRGSSLEQRAALLRPLAEGRASGFTAEVARQAESEPQTALLLVQQLVTRIEAEELSVREAHAPTLRLVLDLLRRFADEDAQASNRRKAGALRNRALAVLDGLGGRALAPEEQLRGLSSEHDAFAGGVRLAPADALPWPFFAPVTTPPSAFVPVVLEPFEKRASDGTSFTAWKLTE